MTLFSIKFTRLNVLLDNNKSKIFTLLNYLIDKKQQLQKRKPIFMFLYVLLIQLLNAIKSLCNSFTRWIYAVYILCYSSMS